MLYVINKENLIEKMVTRIEFWELYNSESESESESSTVDSGNSTQHSHTRLVVCM